jgi:hypothetical protein
MQAPGLEFADKGRMTVWTERVTVAEPVTSESLADDDPEVSILHWRKA